MTAELEFGEGGPFQWSDHSSWPEALPMTPPADMEATLFDPAFYLETYPDVRASGIPPLHHYRVWGAFEGRDPNPLFSSTWYLKQYPDVQEAGLSPLLHYMRFGARELRNPHPRFDASFYVNRTPEAAHNPLLYHLRFGKALGLPTERVFRLADCLPSRAAPLRVPAGLTLDVVVPVHRGLAQTQRCLRSLLRDASPGLGGPLNRIIVIDDASPEPALSRYLDRLAARHLIVLLRNARNRGFVASANRGIREAGRRDVVLLNSDTEVPAGWLARLAGHAYSHAKVASVSPFSNNATICSYPAIEGGPMPFGESLARIDTACRTANLGRSVSVPTTVGYCMYLRRAALDDVGVLDEKAFGRGYGEENDFCMRASAAGWRHLLACDVFVYHEGSVSFGAGAPELASGRQALDARWPDYARRVGVHVRLNEASPFRLATTLQLFATNGLPTILSISHAYEGGVGQHIRMLAGACIGRANILVLRATMDAQSVRLGAPGAHRHSEVLIPNTDEAVLFEDLLTLLKPLHIARVHVHHWLNLGFDLRRLVQTLNVPFDVTIHDWFAICPRVNMLPVADGAFCGMPAPDVCDRCIQARDDTDATDIISWRAENTWLLRLADRVLCATQDSIDRLRIFGLASRAVLAPLEDVATAAIQPIRRSRSAALRVAVLGVLADHKGAVSVTAVAELTPPDLLTITLIGHAERPLPTATLSCLSETGEYEAEELPALIKHVDPDVIWFPATWPETWSYTLTAAIRSGRPIVASDLGAFRARLTDYPQALLVRPDAAPNEWVEALAAAVAGSGRPPLAAKPTPASPPFYPDRYLRSVSAPAVHRKGVKPTTTDLRGAGKMAVVLVPERLEIGVLSPCTFIRTLLPMSHPIVGHDIEVTLATAEEALQLRADLIVTQRYAVPGEVLATALLKHAARMGTPLLYDLDDNLMELPSDHPDLARLTPRTACVATLLRGAHIIHASTSQLARCLGRFAEGERARIQVVENALDERLWALASPPTAQPASSPLRILYMGTATHGADLDLVLPALARLHETFGHRIAIEIVGITAEKKLPPFITRVEVPHRAGLSYPAFVAWLIERQRRLPWSIGIAPLTDTPFNRCKSPIKMLDYAALGLATVASDMLAYQREGARPMATGTGIAGCFLAATDAEWFHALAKLIREPNLRLAMAGAGRATLLRDYTLAAQSERRQAALMQARSAVQPRGRQAIKQPASAIVENAKTRFVKQTSLA